MTNQSSDELLNQDPREAYQQADQQNQPQQPTGSIAPPEYQQGNQPSGQKNAQNTTKEQARKQKQKQQRQQPQQNQQQQNRQQRQQQQGQQAGAEKFGDVDMPNMKFQSDKMEQAQPAKEAEQAQQQIDELKDSTEKQYRDRLEANDISLGEAEQIIDQVILREEPYREKFDIYKGLQGVFRTRSEMDVQSVYRQLEAEGPNYQLTQNNILARWNLASALAAYGDRTFGSTPEDVNEAAHFVSNLNYRVVQLLTRKFQEFDRKMNLVFSEGYLDVF